MEIKGDLLNIGEKKRVSFHTLGCRLNFSESGSISQGFAQRGFEIVDFGSPADVVFLNTCTVTDQADSTCRNLIRKAHGVNPEAKIVVAGCYAQMEAPTIAKMSGVDLVLGTHEKYKVFEYLEEEEKEVIHIDRSTDFWPAATSPSDFHTRAFLKIQDGCNYVCSFCIIPFARGRSRASAIKDVLGEAQTLINNGYKEIVLTGVNIGEYEANTGEKLSTLVRELSALNGLERIRLSSVEPNTIGDDLIEAMISSPKFMDHFHLPLQSGDDNILKSMRRKYNLKEYKAKLAMLKGAFPNASFGADIIVGYPGETEAQFENTYNFLQESELTHFHVFPFSARQGTTAARLSEKVQKGLKKQRVRSLISLGEKKLERFMQTQVGKTHHVLLETSDESGRFEGLTTNYLRLKINQTHENQSLRNQIKTVKAVGLENGKLVGDILSDSFLARD